MESDPSCGAPLIKCNICYEQPATSKCNWNPLPEINITRELCPKCEESFNNIIRVLIDRAKIYIHSSYLEWEQKERVHQQTTRKQRQYTLPNI